MLQEIYQNPKIAEHLQTRYNETLHILAEHSGMKMEILVFHSFSLCTGFRSQADLGYPLEEWTKTIYPEPLCSLGADMYGIMTNTTAATRIIAGYFLKKVLDDTKAKINGTLHTPERKMLIYSAHEMNIATALISLNALKINHIPEYGSYLLFEVHKIDGVYGIKLFYQNYEQQDPVPLKVSGCDYFCPYKIFYNLVEDNLPTDDTECFGSS